MFLDRLFHAYDVVLAHPPPAIEAFPAALAQFDAERAILFPSYFKFVKAQATAQPGPGQWEMMTTSGLRFNADGTPNSDDPILFVRFFDAQGEVARQPISAGALLELRALGSEVQTYRELRKLRPPDEGLVEELLYQKQSVKLFYHPELTTYSAAAHLMSFATMGIFTTDLVMILGPRLADLALNLTPTLFNRLTPPKELDYGQRRLRGFRQHADRGYVFGCLCYHFRGLSKHLRDGNKFTDALLEKARLPIPGALYDAAIRFVAGRKPSQIGHPDLRRIRVSLQQAGLSVLARRREPDPIGIADWPNLPSPRIMDHNAETFHVGHPVLSEADADLLNDCSDKLDRTVRSALRAVRGLEFQFNDFVY